MVPCLVFIGRKSIDIGSHVVMGAGLGFDVRLDLIRAMLEASDMTTAHLEDTANDPAGMPAFKRGVVSDHRDYPPRDT